MMQDTYGACSAAAINDTDGACSAAAINDTDGACSAAAINVTDGTCSAAAINDTDGACPAAVLSDTDETCPAAVLSDTDGTCSAAAINDSDALSLFQKFAEQKREERENDPEVKRVKNKYKLKAPKYPSPGNVLHTGRQLLRTPGPGVLPPLPSQIFHPRTDENKQLWSPRADTDNMVASGRQLPRTPAQAEEPTEPQVTEGDRVKSTNDSDRGGAVADDMADEESARSQHKCAVPRVSNPVILPSGGDAMAAQKDAVSEDGAVLSRPEIQDKRRISQMPVQGLNQMRISGVLQKLAGYECRSEDLEFLRHIKNQEKAKVLKEELLCLRKNIAAADQEKELLLAQSEKIAEDIEKMKVSFDGMVQLGRRLLSRTQGPGSAVDLSPDEVLKQLNSTSVQYVQQQARRQLAEVEKALARRRQEASDRTSLAENRKRSLTLQVASCAQEVSEVQSRVRQLQEEAIALKTRKERTEEKTSELETFVQKVRLQIDYCAKHMQQNNETGEEQRQKMQRRLQRILHRKDNYLERERILQKLNAELQEPRL